MDNWFGEIVLSVCGSGGLLSLSLSLFLSLPRSFLSHLLLSILISSRYSQSQNIAHTDAKVALYVGARATNTS